MLIIDPVNAPSGKENAADTPSRMEPPVVGVGNACEWDAKYTSPTILANQYQNGFENGIFRAASSAGNGVSAS